jgi:hypothetical protein
MPMPSVYVTRFFQLITARRFAEAERVLLRLRQKIPKTEWNTGYFQALRGMLLAQRNNDDRYVFLLNLNLKDTEELRRYRREFLKHARNKLHADYDRGFFAAWASYMRVLSRLEFEAERIKSKRRVEKGAEKIEAEKKMAEEEREKIRVEERREIKETVEEDTTQGKFEKTEKAEGIEQRQKTLFDFSQ